MEVEVKLRLPSAEAHARVAQVLKDSHEATFFQENIFFDGANRELSSNRITLRLRFYDGDRKCVVTVKGKAVLVDGVGTSSEEEEEIDPALGRSLVAEPSLLMTSTSSLISGLISRLGCKGFVCLGGFKNVRSVFAWNGVKLELDETQFHFGTQYEIECETPDPSSIKPQLEAFLQSSGVPYVYSNSTKFAIFRSGQLPPYPSRT